MKWIMNQILSRRADELADRLRPHLPPGGRVLDIGSGTGHTALALRRRAPLEVVQADVTDLSVVGARPIRFDETLPFADGAFAAALILFVLQYPGDPLRLLREAARVTAGPLLVVQSTYCGRLGHATLRANEFLWGPVAFLVARRVGLVGPCPFTLAARRLFTRPELRDLFQHAGLRVRTWHAQPWPVVPISYDLFILERHDEPDAPESALGDHSRPE